MLLGYIQGKTIAFALPVQRTNKRKKDQEDKRGHCSLVRYQHFTGCVQESNKRIEIVQASALSWGTYNYTLQTPLPWNNCLWFLSLLLLQLKSKTPDETITFPCEIHNYKGKPLQSCQTFEGGQKHMGKGCKVPFQVSKVQPLGAACSGVRDLFSSFQ